MTGDSTDPPDRRGISEALLLALTTDQFVLQSAASTTVSEAVGRATLFTSALSSSLVALGFAASRPALLEPMVAVVIPTIFVLGIFTVVRLVDTSIANIRCLAQIAHVRQRYAAIDDEAPAFFPAGGDRTDQALRALATRGTRLPGLFTTASMIATMNSIVGGVGAALLVRLACASTIWLWVAVGVLVFVACMLAFLRYQYARSRALSV